MFIIETSKLVEAKLIKGYKWLEEKFSMSRNVHGDKYLKIMR